MPPVSVLLRVEIPTQSLHKALLFEPHLPVWFAKQLILDKMSKDEENVINYGLFIPPANGKAGKFLDEERLLASYGLENNDLIVFKLKRKLYKENFEDKELIAANSKQSRKKCMEYIGKKNAEKVTKALKSGLDPNFVHENGDTPLAYAAAQDAKEVIVALVEGGAYLDYRCADSLTPMHKAANLGSLVALKTMLDLGASSNFRDKNGLTPLYHTCISGQYGAAEMLLKYEAQLQVCDHQAWAELHQACKHGHPQIVELLIWYGANVDAQNFTGNTALHVSILHQQHSCTRTLLKRGANKDVKNKGGQTAYQMAAVSNFIEIAEFIKGFSSDSVVKFTTEPVYERRRKLSATSSSLSSKSTKTMSSSNQKKKVQVSKLLRPTNGTVLYPYRASRADELDLTEGDTVIILQKGDDGWWEGTIGEKTGWFPSNYVEEENGGENSVLLPPPPPTDDDGDENGMSRWMSTDRISRFARQNSIMSLATLSSSTLSLNTPPPPLEFGGGLPPPPPEFSSSNPSTPTSASPPPMSFMQKTGSSGNLLGTSPAQSVASAILNRNIRAKSFNSGGAGPPLPGTFLPPPPPPTLPSLKELDHALPPPPDFGSLPPPPPPSMFGSSSSSSSNGIGGGNSLPPPPPNFDFASLPPPPPSMLAASMNGFSNDDLPPPPPF